VIRVAPIAFWLLALSFAGANPSDHAVSFGYLEPYNSYKLSLSETGILREMPVKEGDRVQVGQLLARLDCRRFEAELGIAKAQAEFFATRFEKFEELKKSGRLSPEEYDKARMELEVQRNKVAAVEAEIELRTIRSPCDGVVTEVKRKLSESMTPAVPYIFTVVELNNLLVQLFLPPTEARQYSKDQPVRVSVGDVGAEVRGVVEFVSPVTDAASNTVRLRIKIPNTQGELPTGVKASLLGAGQ